MFPPNCFPARVQRGWDNRLFALTSDLQKYGSAHVSEPPRFRAGGDEPEVRNGAGFSARLQLGTGQELFDKRRWNIGVNVDVDVDEVAGRRAKEEPDVAADREVRLELCFSEPEVGPAGDRRSLLARTTRPPRP